MLHQLQIVQIKLEEENGQYITFMEHVSNFKDNSKYKLYSSSSNLERVGLLNIN